MLAFLRVAELGGFAPAARSLGISTSAISRQVSDIEDWLDSQLFNRTTRHVSLTGAGAEYLDECRQLVAGMDSLESAARDKLDSPQGRLRVTAPVFLGKELLSPSLPGFFARYPGVLVELVLIDRFVNLVEEGFDVALRVGELQDSTMIARRMSRMALSIVASPDYIREFGRPETAEELRSHNCLIDTAPHHGARWPLKLGSSRVWKAQGNFIANSGELIRDLAVAGSGVALLPTFFVQELIAQGKLVSLLEGQIRDVDAGIHLTYPQARHVSRSVKAFVDFVVSSQASNSLGSDK